MRAPSWALKDSTACPAFFIAPAMRVSAAGDQPDGVASEPSGVDIFKSLASLGLALEKTRAPILELIVDHIDKTPTEN